MTGVIFENATLFDGVAETAPDGMSVLIDGGRIREVSDTRIASSHAERVDCRGRFLMPGLIDVHVHVYIESLKLGPPEPPITYRAQYARNFLSHLLACGFTSVRDVAGGDHGLAMALREGFLDGPRFFYGGLCLSQTGGHGDMRPAHQGGHGDHGDCCGCGTVRNAFAVIADGVDECVKAVRSELRKGAHHIKIMASGGVMSPTDPMERCQYSEAEIRAIVEECERPGKYVAAHCHPPEAIRRCAELGVRSIEHGTMIDEATAKIVAAHGAYVVPTVSVHGALAEVGLRQGLAAAAHEKLLSVAHGAIQGLAIMKKAGVKMGFGTDLLGPLYTRQGSEFTARREVLPALDILRSANSINAEILGMAGELGVVKPGAMADLLLVDGNPLQDIGVLAGNGEHLDVIMKDGRFIKRRA